MCLQVAKPGFTSRLTGSEGHALNHQPFMTLDRGPVVPVDQWGSRQWWQSGIETQEAVIRQQAFGGF